MRNRICLVATLPLLLGACSSSSTRDLSNLGAAGTSAGTGGETTETGGSAGSITSTGGATVHPIAGAGGEPDSTGGTGGNPETGGSAGTVEVAGAGGVPEVGGSAGTPSTGGLGGSTGGSTPTGGTGGTPTGGSGGSTGGSLTGGTGGVATGGVAGSAGEPGTGGTPTGGTGGSTPTGGTGGTVQLPDECGASVSLPTRQCVAATNQVQDCVWSALQNRYIWQNVGGVCNFGCSTTSAECNCTDTTGRYIYDSRAVVYDTQTNLLWAEIVSHVTRTAATLAQHCDGAAGTLYFNNAIQHWRVPTVTEMHTILWQAYPNESCSKFTTTAWTTFNLLAGGETVFPGDIVQTQSTAGTSAIWALRGSNGQELSVLPTDLYYGYCVIGPVPEGFVLPP